MQLNIEECGRGSQKGGFSTVASIIQVRKAVRRFLEADNPVSHLGLMGFRATVPIRYYRAKLASVPGWIVRSRELGNFTYDLTAPNRMYLACTVSVVTGVDVETIASYIREPENDGHLIGHITRTLGSSRFRTISDEKPHFGRRLGWYAFVRALKPKVVIETGIEKGLGAVLLSAALMKNAAEGHGGFYYGTDIDPDAGFLLGGPWSQFGRILRGDSIESLRTLTERIDLFINDSDHAAEYEIAEYRTIKDKLSERAVILGDNSHVSTKLCEFAAESGRQFLFFAEQPFNHWYPGSGIGVCFADASRTKR